ncbi:MAG TPA: aminomethyl-transferring glycine dehydrogenase subunit GcvPB [Candidatus Polarisedimenticolia bacterium]|nr:aminomethyl-transferring glycine dehydrogenase subunit GcvPB [Candidatus Polarisedimenticolia bacterium]
MEPRNLRDPEKLLFELSRPGRRGFAPPPADIPDPGRFDLDRRYTRDDIEGFPQLSEPEVVRHYTRLSRLNYAIDLGLYPLGSCTMKYNPKVHETLARLPGFAGAHPQLPEEFAQGSLRLMHDLERALVAICGMDRFTLQPAAGAQGEQTGIMMARAYHRERGDPRQVVLIPDSAHGTNPASAVLSGYRVEQIASDARGCVDLEALRRRMSEDVAVLMLTNPNTLGVFESEIEAIARVVHAKGGLLYMDGANLNAFVGVARPGDMGVDVHHLNLHKTFSTPHGGGGPGAGPVGVKKHLEPYLPVPTVEKEGERYRLRHDRPQSIGRVRSFFGNFGMHLRAFAYILALGPAGLRRMAETAVLNANYLRRKLEPIYHLPYDAPSLHEVVFSDRHLESAGVHTLDIAKRLMDYGFHPMTIYFPLIVKGAMMIEPTESESREELDAFIAAMRRIDEEARRDPDMVRTAPHTTPVRRLDEVGAARHPVLRWTAPAGGRRA